MKTDPKRQGHREGSKAVIAKPQGSFSKLCEQKKEKDDELKKKR